MTDMNPDQLKFSQLPTAHVGAANKPRSFEPHELTGVNMGLGKLALGEPITGRERLIEGWQRATHDSLMPQMLNREGIDEWFERYRPHAAGIMLLDIEGFKNFNDSFGQKVGDRILQGVGGVFMDRLRMKDEEFPDEKRSAQTPTGDVVARNKAYKDEAAARYGGDEFMAVINLDAVPPKERENVMETIRTRMAKFDNNFRIDSDNEVPIHIRSVYRISVDPNETIDSIYTDLSPALVEAKKSEKGKI